MILFLMKNALWAKFIIFLIFSIVLYMLFLKQIHNIFMNNNCKYTENCDFRQKNQRSIDDNRRQTTFDDICI